MSQKLRLNLKQIVFMCINNHWIYNRYVGRMVLCKCGHCPSCQQAKADRNAMRIINHSRNGYIALFVHLTYMDCACPYILTNEIKTLESQGLSFQPLYYKECLNVYRDCFYTIQRDLKGKIIDTNLIYSPKTSLSNGSQNHPYLIYKYPSENEEYQFQKLRGQSNPYRVGVLYYPDLQNFFKRLRKKAHSISSLAKDEISYFACGEYGTNYQRPHFHLLLYVPINHLEEWKRAIVDSWSFAIPSLTFRNIEVAKNAAAYVSTYINKPSNFPRFFRENCSQRFRERFSHSKNFGRGNENFQFRKILENVRNGVVVFDTQQIVKGEAKTISLPYPKYITNRYIPSFCKGFSRLTDFERIDVASGLRTLSEIVQSDPRRFNYSLNDVLVNGLTQDGFLFDENQTPYFCEDSFFVSKRSQVFQNQHDLFFAQHQFDLCYQHFLTDYIKTSHYIYVPKTYIYSCEKPINLRLLYGDFVRCYLLAYRSFLWNQHFSQNVFPFDNLDRYDNLNWNIKDITLKSLIWDAASINPNLSFFKQLKAYEKFKNSLGPNSRPCRINFTILKNERFMRKIKHHKINDLIYNYDEY